VAKEVLLQLTQPKKEIGFISVQSTKKIVIENIILFVILFVCFIKSTKIITFTATALIISTNSEN
jgi:hypothetical protein